jgi:hypothetical protein|nr:MAG TPA: hypothetical protein [Caudoviricetes sp.]
MGGINEATEVARGISEQGFLVMTAAFFLVLSAMMMVACFKWFKSIITKSMEDYSESLKELIEKTNDQNNMLSDISEGLRPETQLRIKNMTSEFFNLSARRVLEIIEQVRKENHISDRNSTHEKIIGNLTNQYEDRNSRFDYFTYRGKRLSCYTNPEWIDWVAEVVENEIYAHTVNDDRAKTNVFSVYDRIKLDFYHRLNNE